MKFIEIQDGITVNSNSIDGIEEVDNMTCKVYVGTRVYLATMPYSTLIQMLKMEDAIDRNVPKEERMEKTMKKLNGVLDTVGFFAG